MATIKSFTDINQSRKLAEILPFESADMWWLYITAQGKYIAMMHDEPDPHYLVRMESYGIKDAAIRCWSLAALLGVLPYPSLHKTFSGWRCDSYDKEGTMKTCRLGENADNPVDACYEMIIRLNELNLL
jgi:hypothetical protein